MLAAVCRLSLLSIPILLYFVSPTLFSRFIMPVWIYRTVDSRFAAILGKKRVPKGTSNSRKTEIEASLDLILIWWKERELLQREREKRRSEKYQFGLRETEPSSCSRTTKRGLILSHAVPFYQPHAMRPHTSAWNGQLNGNPIVQAPSEGFRQGLG